MTYCATRNQECYRGGCLTGCEERRRQQDEWGRGMQTSRVYGPLAPEGGQQIRKPHPSQDLRIAPPGAKPSAWSVQRNAGARAILAEQFGGQRMGFTPDCEVVTTHQRECTQSWELALRLADAALTAFVSQGD